MKKKNPLDRVFTRNMTEPISKVAHLERPTDQVVLVRSDENTECTIVSLSIAQRAERLVPGVMTCVMILTLHTPLGEEIHLVMLALKVFHPVCFREA
jgi:hypothetical protein